MLFIDNKKELHQCIASQESLKEKLSSSLTLQCLKPKYYIHLLSKSRYSVFMKIHIAFIATETAD